MNIVWGTASTGGYGGTVFPGGVRYSLVNNVCGVRYSLGYRIHSDTGPFRKIMTAGKYYLQARREGRFEGVRSNTPFDFQMILYIAWLYVLNALPLV